MYTRPKMKEKRRTDAGTELKAKEKDLKNWGDYLKACHQFAEGIKGLPGLRAFAAKHCGDYVDLWVFTDEAHQFELIRPVGRTLKKIWGRFPQLCFDSFVTRQEIPPDFIIFYKAS